MPYREPAPATDRCEICGQPGERCAPCAAVLALEGLELPVVVVGWSWNHSQPFVSIGMVLIDRWREIARCAYRIAISRSMRHQDAELFARARAALWSPAARVPSNRREYDDSLLEALRRTHFVDYGPVRDCFADAVDLAFELAEGAREYDLRGTWIEEWELGLWGDSLLNTPALDGGITAGTGEPGVAPSAVSPASGNSCYIGSCLR